MLRENLKLSSVERMTIFILNIYKLIFYQSNEIPMK